MAKSKQFLQRLPYDFGKQVTVGIKKVEGGEFSVHLDDGTVIAGRTVIVEVKRSLDRHNEEGEPVYALGTAQAIKAKIPPRLRLAKPAKKRAAKKKEGK